MITMLYAWIDGVIGMEVALVCYAICVLVYFLLCFMFRANRICKRSVLYGWLVCEVICDLLWYFYYFENGNYMNRGLHGSMACMLLPFLLFVTGLIVTALNKSDFGK